MESIILESIGIDPGYILIGMAALILLLFILLISLNIKYNRLKRSYHAFMEGKDGKSLEETFQDKFDEIDEVINLANKNKEDINDLYDKFKESFQKVGIVRYDAFNEMGGKLSFALTLLDGNDNGYIINTMHSREGCYAYVKEIENGQCSLELAEEEKQSLENAIHQEKNVTDEKNINK